MNQYLVTRTVTETIVVEAKDEADAVEIASSEVIGWETEDTNTYMVELMQSEDK